MKRYLTVWFLVSSFTGYGQVTNTLDSILGAAPLTSIDTVPTIERELKLAIEAVDGAIDSLVGKLYNYKPSRFTVVDNNPIFLRKCVDKRTLIEVLTNDSIQMLGDDRTHAELWADLSEDTSAFLAYNRAFVGSTFEELPSGGFQLDDGRIWPLQYHPVLKHLVYLTEQKSNALTNLFSVQSKSERKEAFVYLSENYDYFDVRSETLETKAIQIKYLVNDCGSQIYAGVDIYGAHFLITISKRDWNITIIERLWTY